MCWRRDFSGRRWCKGAPARFSTERIERKSTVEGRIQASPVPSSPRKCANTRSIFDFPAENAKNADCLAERSRFELSGDFLGGPEQALHHDVAPNEKGTELLTRPIPRRTLWLLLLDRRLLLPSCRPIPFTEALPAPAIASLDEARSKVVTPAVAAGQLLRFRLTPHLFP